MKLLVMRSWRGCGAQGGLNSVLLKEGLIPN